MITYLMDPAGLLEYIDQLREQLSSQIENIDPSLEISPGWTIKEILGHITAWEIVIHKAIRAFLAKEPPYFLQEQNFDIFNQEAVDYRASWSLEEVIQEWKQVRKELRGTITTLSENDLAVEMVLPWGSERPLAELIEILGEHDFEHLEDIQKLMG